MQTIVPGKRKGKGLPSQGQENSVDFIYIAPLSLTSALDVGGWSTRRPDRFTPRKDMVPIVYEAGWATGPDWMGAEKLTPAGV